MTIMKLWMPIKRDLWEYKVGLLWIPAAVALVLVLSVLYLAVVYSYDGSSFGGENLIELGVKKEMVAHFNGHLQQVAVNSSVKDILVSYFAVLTTALMLIPLVMVLLVYGHSALFDDRKNREVLFWRSMPVSETQNVLSKLFVIGVVAPSVILVLTLISLVAILLINAFSFFFVAHWQPISILTSLSHPFSLYGIMLFYLVMFFPFIAWIIFCSAAAKKSPFMLSSLAPVFLLALDAMANKYLSIDFHVVSGFKRYVDFLDDITAKTDLPITADLVTSFAVAMLIGTILIWAAIWLRNNRYEI